MRITLAGPDPDWPLQFGEERDRLQSGLGAAQARIEHIGSTAVPGLAAKPIIDIMIGVEDLGQADRLIPALVGQGYRHIPEYERELPERRYFEKFRDSRCTHHIHMVVNGSDFWVRHLAFRDFLRAHPEVRAEYEALKRRLCERDWRDGNEYADAKTEFIRAVENQARETGAGPAPR
jgi:GrpB-like predicted nucleotidyltransferase (UPF0157 family)